jgi:two-component system chemotaxis sensor kinase CheA
MQAIDHVWAKLPRVVRDLAGGCGKRVRLVMVGRETELDRSLLEAVKDPLTHLVRNAVDHGVEPPGVRVAAGKPAEGTLRLRAYHEGGHVVVEVADDGAGIDPDRVARVAVERGLVGRDQLVGMDRREVLGLVFRPGFSTAAAVTNVSGRGVGMDVVKTNIERIGGSVEVDSTVGQGTCWRLTIPLTLAIIQALTIQAGGQRYVIPQVAVHELVYLDGQPGRQVEHAMGAAVYRLRGKLLPLVHLDTTLGLAPGHPAGPDDPAGGPPRGVYVAVLQAEGRRFGLVVDRVLNTEEVVVKPLSARFKDLGVYAGATLLGDGAVALILDVAALARRAALTAADPTTTGGGEPGTDPANPAAAAGGRLLIAAVGPRRMAIPLDLVTRLEEFPTHRIEHAGHRDVVQYRGHILPLLHARDLVGDPPNPHHPDTVPVIVYTEHGQSTALAVDAILDIVETTDHPHPHPTDHPLLSATVINSQVTDLLDVRAAIQATNPHHHTHPTHPTLAGTR